MKILYAPWREDYATGTAHGPQGQDSASPEECVFCLLIAQNNDAEGFILGRYKHNFIMLNRYPYNSGHLLILPFKHTSQLDDLCPETQQELMLLITKSTTLVKNELKAQGVNVGINMGKAAGAGMPAHLHTHILPRWLGDTNFLPTLAQVKQVSTDLTKLYERLRPLFENLLR